MKPESAALLLIDDDETIRHMMTKSLRRSGWEVDEAASALDGLALLEARLYRGVLLDLNMPDISGIEALERLRPKHPELWVILVSGYTPGVELRKLLADDPHLSYLQKPFTLSRMTRTLKAAIGPA